MPPKAKITKDDIIEAAFAITRKYGITELHARRIAQELGCSTQPVMYHFKTMTELKHEVYIRANLFHTEYLLFVKSPNKNRLLDIGLNYIRFAQEEAPLFHLLFQSNLFSHKHLTELVDSEDLMPMISLFQETTGLTPQQTKDVFVTLALFSHGYASLLANRCLDYDESLITSHLIQVYKGALFAVQETSNETI